MFVSGNAPYSSNSVTSGRSHVPLRWKIVGWVSLGVLFSLILGYIYYEFKSYKIIYKGFTITRVLPARFDVNAQIDGMFTRAMKSDYVNGQGIVLSLVTKEEGQPDDQALTLSLVTQERGRPDPAGVFLKPFMSMYSRMNYSVPLRNKEIDAARAQIEKAVDDFNAPAKRKIIVFADNTTGDQLGAAALDQWYERLGLEDSLKAGWRVWLRFHRISDSATTLYDPSPIELADIAHMTQSKPEVLTSMTTTFAPTKAAHSAIATGVFDALQEDAHLQPKGVLDGQTRILLLSDLHENDPDTLSFEQPPLADLKNLQSQIENPDSRKMLENELQKATKCPPLNGAHVDIFFPPNQDALRRSRMLVLFPLWRDLLVSCGAASDVGKHF